VPTLVSYNVLADSYIRPDWYPHTPSEWLDPAVRHPALVTEIVAFDADIVALQEVERPVFNALQERLSALGYVGRYAPKGRNKPDGCATFVRTSASPTVAWQRLAYSDGDSARADSGHVALLALLEVAGKTLGVANTHVKWAPPDTPRAAHIGARQVDELAHACAAQPCDGWVVCGDINCAPDSAVLDGLVAAGFVDAHGGLASATCNANRNPRKLDHVFVADAIDVIPGAIDPVAADTPMPSSSHPSDHLPVHVTLRWRAANS
jgi:mRNA deadenylase 3'-5' endonuclease subunit Ccr4